MLSLPSTPAAQIQICGCGSDLWHVLIQVDVRSRTHDPGTAKHEDTCLCLVSKTKTIARCLLPALDTGFPYET
jgi:hypothetical protein